MNIDRNINLHNIKIESDFIAMSEDSDDDVLPINIVYKRRNNFTPSGSHKQYRFAKWNFTDVFKFIDESKSAGNSNVFRNASMKFGITYGTLRNKYSMWVAAGRVTVCDDNRGGSNKIFSEKEERILFRWIKNVYIKNNFFFDDECLKLTAIKLYNSLYGTLDKSFSEGWIRDFKTRWRLSSRIASFSRIASPIDEKLVQRFLGISQFLYQKTPHQFFFNMDETFWRTINGRLSVMAIKGCDNRKVTTNVTEKDGFTAVFIVSANGFFLKPIIIVKGKTDRCLAKITAETIDEEAITKKYTVSGWISVEIMIHILQEIYAITDGFPSVLILDRFPTHTVDIVQIIAFTLNIHLVYIPAGKTSILQPLDVGINGPIKTVGRMIAKQSLIENPCDNLTMADSVKALIEARSKISQQTIIKSFEKALNIK